MKRTIPLIPTYVVLLTTMIVGFGVVFPVVAGAEETVRIIKKKKKTDTTTQKNVKSRGSRRVVRRGVTRGNVVYVEPIFVEDRVYIEAAPELVEVVPFYVGGSMYANAGISPWVRYIQLDLGYSGVRGEGPENRRIFFGVDYALTLGYGVSYARAEVGIEGRNHWATVKGGFPHDINIYMANVDVKLILPWWYFEPYIYFGIGTGVYHPNPQLVSADVDLWDWGISSRVGVGFQIRFSNYAIGADYNHRWYNFGGETESEEELKMQSSSYRVHASYYF